jgi:AraC-like DNA-binding protein
MLVQSIDQHNGAAGWDEICQKTSLAISPAYAARLFQRHTGQAVRKYAKDKRLSRAVEQLITTDLPIKTIADDLGYRRPFDFARAFRKRYGFTPSRFRANCLRLAFTQTVRLEKAREGIDMVVRSDAQG